MSKAEFKVEDFGHVTDGLIARIEGVMADRKQSRLSSSAIYKAHNELFKLREPIQTCQSCLVIRGDKLAKWYEWNAKQAAPQTPSIQMPVANAGKEGDAAAPVQETHDLEGGSVMTVLADGSVQVDGMAAVPSCIYFLANGGSVVTTEDVKIAPEAVDYAGVVDKYALVIGDTKEGEIATLTTTVEESAPRMTANELALVQARLTELQTPIEVKGSAGEAKQILLQKIDKDDYTKTEGDPFYAAFSASEADAQKGKAVDTETGKAVKPGTYATEDTAFVLSVSVGGAAAYKAV